mmetsp:Transcript_30573/g.77218  ORF Transcript_30573/g.77218 Transcript_30573/m.77218 type:complete len:256 (+) Transcript_30573:569-1336(+)
MPGPPRRGALGAELRGGVPLAAEALATCGDAQHAVAHLRVAHAVRVMLQLHVAEAAAAVHEAPLGAVDLRAVELVGPNQLHVGGLRGQLLQSDDLGRAHAEQVGGRLPKRLAASEDIRRVARVVEVLPSRDALAAAPVAVLVARQALHVVGEHPASILGANRIDIRHAVAAAAADILRRALRPLRRGGAAAPRELQQQMLLARPRRRPRAGGGLRRGLLRGALSATLRAAHLSPLLTHCTGALGSQHARGDVRAE